MSVLKCYIAAALGFASVIAAFPTVANADAHFDDNLMIPLLAAGAALAVPAS